MTTTLVANKDGLKNVLDRIRVQMTQYLRDSGVVDAWRTTVMLAGSRAPELFECTPASMANAIINLCQMGLQPNTPREEAYIVSFMNRKTGNREAQAMPGYRGFIKLATQEPAIDVIEAHVVHARDTFNPRYGTSPEIEHIAYPWNSRDAMGMIPEDAKPGAVIAAYAIAFLANGRKQAEVMSLAELEKIRNSAQGKNRGPWVTWKEQMQRKCPVRRLFKFLPRTSKMDQAIRLEEHIEAGTPQPISVEFETVEVPATTTDRVKAALDIPKDEETQEPEKPETTRDFARDSAENEINAAIEKGIVTVPQMKKICEGIAVEFDEWPKCSDAKMDSILNKVRMQVADMRAAATE